MAEEKVDKIEQEEEEEEVEEEEKVSEFSATRHTKYLLHMLNVLPSPYASQDCNRLTLIYFVIGGLDITDQLDKVNKEQIIEYIYSLQIHPDKNGKNLNNCGFRGGSFFGAKYQPKPDPDSCFHQHDQSHIAMTYTALCVLLMCGDDLSRVNKKAITHAIKSLQLEDGSYCPVAGGSENDMRFIYCAATISYMLNDWSGINRDKAVEYILSSQSYDGGIAQGPGQESHGGSTYCAIAALSLMGRLGDLKRKEDLIRWCLERQTTGFQGRINKITDVCYSYWIGGSLSILGAAHLIEENQLRGHSCACQQPTGGLSKWPNYYPDVLHTYLGMCGLSIIGEKELLPIEPSLGITKRAFSNLKR